MHAAKFANLWRPLWLYQPMNCFDKQPALASIRFRRCGSYACCDLCKSVEAFVAVSTYGIALITSLLLPQSDLEAVYTCLCLLQCALCRSQSGRVRSLTSLRTLVVKLDQTRTLTLKPGREVLLFPTYMRCCYRKGMSTVE